MTSIFDEATPRGSWVAELSKDYDVAAPIADDILREDHGAFESDVRLEIVSAWLRRDPTAAVRASLSVALGRPEDARASLAASLNTFLASHAGYAATIKTPTRRQVARMWGRDERLSLSGCQTIDDMGSADRRAVVRDLIAKGYTLVPRADDDDGGLCHPGRREPRVYATERAGLQIKVVEAEALDEDNAGAVPVPRAPPPPHARWRVVTSAPPPATDQIDPGVTTTGPAAARALSLSQRSN